MSIKTHLKQLTATVTLAVALVILSASVAGADATVTIAGELQVYPAAITVNHRGRPHSALITARSTDGLSIDLTSAATWQSSDEAVATVDLFGWIQPVSNGQATITATVNDRTVSVPVTVQLQEKPRPHSFRHDVMPVLSKGGCNMGSCHGYSLGKNGFKLSLRGSDPGPDYESLTEEFFQRRVNRHNPAASLLITKPLGDVPHQGGVRFNRGSLQHELLLGWVREGAQSDVVDPGRVESVHIKPENAVLRPGMQHQVQLIARYSDGSTRDVTRLGIFTANTELVATVDDVGLVSASELGETAVVARFERIFATANFIVLDPNPHFQPTPVPENLIDRFVIEKLNELNIKPSGIVEDAGFLRRTSLDLIGVQPTPEEVMAFLNDPSPDKRLRAFDALVQRPEFVDWWSLKWGDLLQNSRNRLSDPAVFAFREWIRAAVAENRPIDEFVRELLTSRGNFMDNPAAAYFAVSKDPDETLQRATQVFCGVRMLCAKCHPHPFENWTQADYYGLHSFFNQVTAKNDPRLADVTNAKTIVVNLAAGYSTNPRSGQLQPPRFLGAGEPELTPATDRRAAYAQWLTSPENPHFARSIANRVWSYFFHRGIIDPVDDLRTTNPPINPGLLDALTKEFVEHKFDIRHLMRRIVMSQTYQRSSVPTDSNGHDDLNFSHAIPRRLPAEALLDSLVQATGIVESITGAPAGFSAAQLPDANVTSEFLNLFGKPQRMEACECERDDGANMLQALHFINGKSILARVASPSGRVAQLINRKTPDAELVNQLYLWCLARPATKEEVELSMAFIASYEPEKRAEAGQDLMWALLNSRDFMLVH
ncbi:MAG: DUF1553 domain-containing protein [Planctomycetota bacterium]|nr:DUF1553 domain-containing protein [Planctomycetota bacterium]